MLYDENLIPVKSLSTVADANNLVEDIKAKYGVARPITRQLITDFGLSLPKIFEELKRMGYPVPMVEQ